MRPKNAVFILAVMLLAMTLMMVSGCGDNEQVVVPKTSMPSTPKTSTAETAPTAFDNALKTLAANAQNIIDRSDNTTKEVGDQIWNPDIQNDQQMAAVNAAVAEQYTPIRQGYINEMQNIKQQVEQLTPDTGKENTKTTFIQGIDCYINGLTLDLNADSFEVLSDIGRHMKMGGDAEGQYLDGENKIKQATQQ